MFELFSKSNSFKQFVCHTCINNSVVQIESLVLMHTGNILCKRLFIIGLSRRRNDSKHAREAQFRTVIFLGCCHKFYP